MCAITLSACAASVWVLPDPGQPEDRRVPAELLYGALPRDGRLWNFLEGFWPCGPPLGFWGRGPLLDGLRRAFCWLLRGAPCPCRTCWSGAPSRFPEARLISSSFISSHWASVRSRSGMASSSFKRWRGEFGLFSSIVPIIPLLGFRKNRASDFSGSSFAWGVTKTPGRFLWRIPLPAPGWRG